MSAGQHIDLLVLTVKASAAIGEHLFVTTGGALPAAGGWAAGAARNKAASGDPVGAMALGKSPVVAGAAIAKDAQIMVTAAGKVITHTAGNVCVGRALEAAAADGDVIDALVNTLQ